MIARRVRATVRWFGENAHVIMPLLAFFALALAIWTIVLYTDLRNQRSRLSGIEIARIVEARTSDKQTVIRCRSGIATIDIANVLLSTVKGDLLQRAHANRLLSRQDSSDVVRATRIKAAVAAERQAAKLNLFPKRTQKDCDELRDRLRSELEGKYGEKLRQLEREEAKSRRSDT